MLQKIVELLTKYPVFFLKGTFTTLWLSAIFVTAGTALGTVVAMMKLSKNKLLRAIASTYIEVLRNTPILLQLMIFVFGLPEIGIKLTYMQGVIVAMSLNSGAYVAEIIRSGINAVDKGQAEAARSLGMSHGMTMRRIILPQAVKNILPALGNEFVTLVKESALASIFFLGDLMTQQKVIQGFTFTMLDSLLLCGMIYFVINFSLSRVLSAFERRLAQSD